jgi:hypothetical protein
VCVCVCVCVCVYCVSVAHSPALLVIDRTAPIDTHWRAQVPKNPKAWWSILNPYPFGISLGECVMWAVFVVGTALYLMYFIVYFDYLEGPLRKLSKIHMDTELVGRNLGHLTSMLSGLQLLPALRIPIWTTIFGAPYERVLKYHRILGLITFLAVSGHVIIWWTKWWVEGTLGHNIFAFKDLLIAPTRWAAQDFTIPLGEAGWAGIALSLLLAVIIRRRYYVIFLHSHKYLGILFYVIGINHGWSFW